MTDIYEEMMEVSRTIAGSLPCPRFYMSCAEELQRSRTVFAGNRLVSVCMNSASRGLHNNLGHGFSHAEKVAIEAGALVFLEAGRGAPWSSPDTEIAALAQIAGLLHDVRREEKDHARASARAAGEILDGSSISRDNKQHIIGAIANHEAFVEPAKIASVVGQLISNVLYDADKFRWGPDNFTVTVWEMVRTFNVSMPALIHRFPHGMLGIGRIKETFLSKTGQLYGPEFIDRGLEIGERIYQFLQLRFADELETDLDSPP
jgi:hypothetical protein